jgi:predicted dehydrogenase
VTAGVAIIGCGLVGQKRARALTGTGARLAACVDVRRERAEALARSAPDVVVTDDWWTLLRTSAIDLVVIATTNDCLAEIAEAALAAGKHVLVEKPAARTIAELDAVVEAARRHQRLVRVGFNHRFHPALRRARALVDAGEIGDLMFVRGRYGHGGRVGYDREWRADPALSGGGELIDQGVHLIDLSRWFLGDFTRIEGVARTYYWDMPVDDNAFLTLQTARDRTAFLHVSCTEWKNLFSLEIYGRRGKLQVEGLGGSYGTERLTCYRMRPEMGPPDTVAWEFPRADESWALEFAEFLEDIRLDRAPSPGLDDARAALTVVEQVQRQSGYAWPAPAVEAAG